MSNNRIAGMFGSRQQQSGNAKAGMSKAAEEMHTKTLIQGRQMAFMFIKKKIDEYTPQRWRDIGDLVCPQFYHNFWIKTFAVMQTVAFYISKFMWLVLSTVSLYQIVVRIRRKLQAGGHRARISQTEDEWTVRIQIYKWWKTVYKCDFDVRNGRASEIIDNTKETQNAVQN